MATDCTKPLRMKMFPWKNGNKNSSSSLKLSKILSSNTRTTSRRGAINFGGWRVPLIYIFYVVTVITIACSYCGLIHYNFDSAYFHLYWKYLSSTFSMIWNDYLLWYFDNEVIQILLLCLKVLGTVSILAATLICLDDKYGSGSSSFATTKRRRSSGSSGSGRRGSGASSSSNNSRSFSVSVSVSDYYNSKKGGGGGGGGNSQNHHHHRDDNCRPTLLSPAPFLLSTSHHYYEQHHQHHAHHQQQSRSSSSSSRQQQQQQRPRSISPPESTRSKSPPSLNAIEEKELEDEWDYWWHELDSKTKYYALILGYTQQTWDKDYELEDLQCEDWDWDEMTEEQKLGAQHFGYTKENWHEDDDDEEEVED